MYFVFFQNTPLAPTAPYTVQKFVHPSKIKAKQTKWKRNIKINKLFAALDTKETTRMSHEWLGDGVMVLLAEPNTQFSLANKPKLPHEKNVSWYEVDQRVFGGDLWYSGWSWGGWWLWRTIQRAEDVYDGWTLTIWSCGTWHVYAMVLLFRRL